MSPRAAGLILALTSATVYGVNIAYARLAADAGIPGATLVLYRVGLMLALGALAAAVTRAGLSVPRSDRTALLAMGVCTAIVGNAYLSSVAFIPVTVAVVTFYTFPIVIIVAAPFVDGSRLTPTKLAVALAAFVGVALAVGPAADGLDWRGLALAALASLGAAAQFFAAARLRTTATLTKLVWTHLIVLPPTAALCWALGASIAPAALMAAPLPVAVTIGAFVIGFLTQMMALSRVRAGDAGLAFCVEPVVAALAAVIVLGETIGPLQAAGGALVIGAIIVNVTLKQNNPPRAAGDPDR